MTVRTLAGSAAPVRARGRARFRLSALTLACLLDASGTLLRWPVSFIAIGLAVIVAGCLVTIFHLGVFDIGLPCIRPVGDLLFSRTRGGHHQCQRVCEIAS